MKWIGIAALALAFATSSQAQTMNDTLLVDNGYNFVSDLAKAKHKILVSKNEDGTTRILIFSISGRFQGEENFSHFSYGKTKRIREGKFTKTYANGNDSLVSFYHDDNAVWPKVINYPSGNKWFEYRSDRKICPYTHVKIYYENGNLKQEETTVLDENDVEVTTGHTYDENGNEIAFTPFYHKAEFPGGDANLNSKILEALHYPDDYRKAGVEGKVVVNITIEKNGYPSQNRVVDTTDKGFNDEAVRAVKIATAGRKFHPVTIDGQAVKAIMVVPINFKL